LLEKIENMKKSPTKALPFVGDFVFVKRLGDGD